MWLFFSFTALTDEENTRIESYGSKYWLRVTGTITFRRRLRNWDKRNYQHHHKDTWTWFCSNLNSRLTFTTPTRGPWVHIRHLVLLAHATLLPTYPLACKLVRLRHLFSEKQSFVPPHFRLGIGFTFLQAVAREKLTRSCESHQHWKAPCWASRRSSCKTN